MAKKSKKTPEVLLAAAAGAFDVVYPGATWPDGYISSDREEFTEIARAVAGVLLRHLREMAMEGPMLGTNDIDGLALDLGIEMEDR